MLRRVALVLVLGGCRQLLGLSDLPPADAGDDAITGDDAHTPDATPGATPDATPDAFIPAFAKRYNLGGAAFDGTDYPGHWDADPGNICTGNLSNTGGGSLQLPTDAPISGTVDDSLFEVVYWSLSAVTCAVPVPSGSYVVTLLIGSIYAGGGANPACVFATADDIFDITLEGILVQTGFDLVVASGGCIENGSTAHPVARSFTVAVTDGMLDVKLVPTTGAAMLSAISVVSAP